ncbi:MAG: riboflavin synthase [Myxococcales bacterium]|nr:riboflavin synthase [Myxococcales bacterium]|tara:strand:- start:12 stop:620 length:609 start_codon:yes stop_codon:yes gene_type:complete
MFTGIVACCGRIKEATLSRGILRLQVETPDGLTTRLERGASVSVNGVCLTVVEWTANSIQFDVIQESLDRSNLGTLSVGDSVNLERAARFGDEIGGHMLSGHIHTQAEIAEIVETEDNVSMRLKFDAQWRPFVISKGYIAIDGCSLTIGEVSDFDFWIHLIPETLRITHLNERRPGDTLNIEIDHQTQVIVETVERYLKSRS